MKLISSVLFLFQLTIFCPSFAQSPTNTFFETHHISQTELSQLKLPPSYNIWRPRPTEIKSRLIANYTQRFHSDGTIGNTADSVNFYWHGHEGTDYDVLWRLGYSYPYYLLTAPYDPNIDILKVDSISNFWESVYQNTTIMDFNDVGYVASSMLDGPSGYEEFKQYEYNSGGKVVAVNSSTTTLSGDFYSTRVEYTYSDDGDITSELLFNWNTITESWDNFDWFTFSYDENSNLLTTHQKRWGPKMVDTTIFVDTAFVDTTLEIIDWVDVALAERNFDESNNCTQQTKQYWNAVSEEWINFAQLIYGYNTDHKLAEILERNWDETLNEWINNTRHSISYSGDLANEMIIDSWDGTSWIYPSIYIYSYTGSNLAEMTVRAWSEDLSDYVNWSKYNFSYNDYGQLTELYTERWNEEGTWISTEGDGKHNFIYELIDTDPSNLQSIKKNMNFLMYPNPANEDLTLHSNEPIDNLIVMDMAGKAIMTKDNIHESTVSVSLKHLLPGSYLIKVDSRGKQKSRVFVKR